MVSDEVIDLIPLIKILNESNSDNDPKNIVCIQITSLVYHHVINIDKINICDKIFLKENMIN